MIYCGESRYLESSLNVDVIKIRALGAASKLGYYSLPSKFD